MKYSWDYNAQLIYYEFFFCLIKSYGINHNARGKYTWDTNWYKSRDSFRHKQEYDYRQNRRNQCHHMSSGYDSPQIHFCRQSCHSVNQIVADKYEPPIDSKKYIIRNKRRCSEMKCQPCQREWKTPEKGNPQLVMADIPMGHLQGYESIPQKNCQCW